MITNLDPAIVTLTAMAIIVIVVVWSWHADKTKDFHLQQVLVDSVTGKIAIEKVGYMTVLALMSWGFVTLILRDKLSEWYAGLFAGVFVLGRVASSWMAVKKDIAMSPPSEIQPQGRA